MPAPVPADCAVALETSSRRPSAALRCGEQVLLRFLDGARSHASDLVPALAEMFTELGARPDAIAAVLVGTGPGSFTGLRVGIATGLGLQRASTVRGAGIRGIPSGETVAFAELEQGQECVTLQDARGGLLYFAHYRRDAQDVVALHAPCVLERQQLAPLLPRAVPIFGDASVAQAAELSGEALERLRTDTVPRADALLALGLRRLRAEGSTPPAELQPLYLRAFAARRRSR